MLNAQRYYSEYQKHLCSFIVQIYAAGVALLCFFLCQPQSSLQILFICIIMWFIRQICSDGCCICLCRNQLLWNNKIRIQTSKTTAVLVMLLIFQGRGVWTKLDNKWYLMTPLSMVTLFLFWIKKSTPQTQLLNDLHHQVIP